MRGVCARLVRCVRPSISTQDVTSAVEGLMRAMHSVCQMLPHSSPSIHSNCTAREPERCGNHKNIWEAAAFAKDACVSAYGMTHMRRAPAMRGVSWWWAAGPGRRGVGQAHLTSFTHGTGVPFHVISRLPVTCSVSALTVCSWVLLSVT